MEPFGGDRALLEHGGELLGVFLGGVGAQRRELDLPRLRNVDAVGRVDLGAVEVELAFVEELAGDGDVEEARGFPAPSR